jgi:large subunit ribosomal protein L36
VLSAHLPRSRTAGNSGARCGVQVIARRKPTPARKEVNVMKVRNSLRSLKSKPGSIVTRRRGRQVVINTKNPRWNGRQG